MPKPSEAAKVPPAWLAFFQSIRDAARRLDELEAQECNTGSRQ